jgi:DNA repair protein RadA/Sms
MGSSPHSIYRCTECGAEHPKWVGRCDGCGAWNTVAEEPAPKGKPRGRLGRKGDLLGAAVPVRLSQVAAAGLKRWKTGINEFDFVLGGGVVPGSLAIVGGEPGIGKSTLLLQCAARLEAGGIATLYVSGEESAEQVRLRADRLGGNTGEIRLLPEVRLEAIVASAVAAQAQVVVVDSIQTTYTEELEGAPGNVGQVRECAARLMRFAKESGTAVLLVGHVTRGGVIAGPKTLEHIVDTVLYFEGEPSHDYRVLRAVKNRFGSVDEVGVFEMTSAGLVPVPNPSATFLAGRDTIAPGSAVTALMEGSRPMLVEIQALAVKAGFGTPQRVATGLDQRRLAVLLAVLERRAALPFHDLDVFVNVTGGMRLVEPASDLAVVAALCSAVSDRPNPPHALFVGEVGLGGEVRPASGLERRIAEAERLGFRQVYVSARSRLSGDGTATPVAHVADLARRLTARGMTDPGSPGIERSG